MRACVLALVEWHVLMLIISDRPQRTLDDNELDSGDDEGRWDRRGSPMDEDAAEYSETVNIMDLNLGRTAEPESTDGQVGSLAQLSLDDWTC